MGLELGLEMGLEVGLEEELKVRLLLLKTYYSFKFSIKEFFMYVYSIHILYIFPLLPQ